MRPTSVSQCYAAVGMIVESGQTTDQERQTYECADGGRLTIYDPLMGHKERGNEKRNAQLYCTPWAQRLNEH